MITTLWAVCIKMSPVLYITPHVIMAIVLYSNPRVAVFVKHHSPCNNVLYSTEFPL